jgi:translation initiation factor IF-2
MRIYQLSKELDIVSKDLIAMLADMGITVKGHMSGLDDETVAKIKNQLMLDKPKAENESQKKSNTKDPLQEKAKKIIKEAVEESKGESPPEDVSKNENIREIEMKFPLTVGELAKAIGVKTNELIKKLMERKIFAAVNQQVTKELVEDILLDYGFLLKERKKARSDRDSKDRIDPFATEDDDLDQLQLRSPIITLMGHVDHGKTSLLDALRNTKVTEGEAGGITQHIGACEVSTGQGRVVFVDTPGHAAFTAMRARGAQVTDIVVLVVAADDGVMPQTIEAIAHARAAEVPIIVAVNKVDKPDADPQRVRTQLTEYDLLAEEWGGKTIFLDVSAHSRQGLDELLEMLALESEMLELRANPHKNAEGLVLEAHLEKSRGAIATLIVMGGTLCVGDVVLAGHCFGKIRAMFNDQGGSVKEAGPATPVEVLGLNGVPNAGDKFKVFESQKKARQHHEELFNKNKEVRLAKSNIALTLEDLYSQIEQGEIKELNVIVKADNMGSLEALSSALKDLSTNQVELKIIHQGIGQVTESDILLAKASGAIVFTFHLSVNVVIEAVSKRESVEMRHYSIIYEVIDDVRNAMEGVLDDKEVETAIGTAEVRALFKSSKVGVIAGSYVTSGIVQKNAFVRVMRDGELFAEDKIGTLKREKDDVKEIKKGFECGIVLTQTSDFKEGDIFEVYLIEKEKQFLN